ncbi:MAG: LacI family DNA-binding transcriptional regulator [Fimbriimonadaceae bacterium]|nr:LacI family DNA-binding transcriptional regulator [Fimbriimonadaceae bacterium]
MGESAPMPHEWNRARSATLKDVAREVGVCESTVSVVLNGARSGTRVSERTREAVITAARRLGYRPNGQARSLVTGRTGRIALYCGSSVVDRRNLFFMEVMCGMLAACDSRGLNLLIHGPGRNEADILNLVSNRSVDGIVMVALSDDPMIGLLNDLKVPAISIGDRIPGLPCVVTDDAAGGVMQAEYLSYRGHRRVLYRASQVQYDSAKTRQQAFVTRATELGMDVMVVSEPTGFFSRLSRPEWEAIEDAQHPVTAIVGWEDVVAGLICEELRSAGRRVGQEIDVIGFNGFEYVMRPVQRLTSIDAHWWEIGEKSVELLETLLNGGSISPKTTFPVHFIQGETA